MSDTLLHQEKEVMRGGWIDREQISISVFYETRMFSHTHTEKRLNNDCIYSLQSKQLSTSTFPHETSSRWTMLWHTTPQNLTCLEATTSITNNNPG
ncbi:hypothetical protein EGR_09256 [Echinococcus granulosus]|uniref:Uncharacterized protein n=1 Tax=Echinococcus granulosus TaxID=6210 RepID=W6UR52_ECHGR|nr:hypothetical protein EGR_09256 [Echinococcus granulosus]EUB55899.1 hypothetical protein EGR_09256 [Echinococcus granulosus]